MDTMEEISTQTMSHNGFLMTLAFIIASGSALMALMLLRTNALIPSGSLSDL